MNADTEPQPAQQPSAPAENAVRPAPVMDVVVPRGEASATEPVVQKEPSAKSANESPNPIIQQEIKKEKVETARAQAVKASKQPGSGVGLAIAGTVIIVLGLASLAVIAYIKTK